MSVDYKVRQIYNVVIKEVTETQESWKSVLRLAGQIYRYEFDNVLMVYAQKPHATLVADFDTWKKVGRYVKRGSKGIAIYPSRALQPYMRYVFDISDTGGKQSELTWNLDGDKLPEFMEYQVAHGKYQKYEGVTREDSLIALKDFTKREIGVIIEEEFENRMTELSQITGSVIKEFSEKREGLHEVPDLAELARKGILYVVGTRCGFDLSAEEQDFSQIVKVTDEDTIYRLGPSYAMSPVMFLEHLVKIVKRLSRKGELHMVAELEYKEVDGLLYPVLEIPDEKENLARLGKYGRQAMKYLEENEPARYKNLLRTGRMTEKMLEVEEEANRMMEQLQNQYLIKNKPQNPSSTMEMWKLREQAKMMAEEIVLAEIVLKYH